MPAHAISNNFSYYYEFTFLSRSINIAQISLKSLFCSFELSLLLIDLFVSAAESSLSSVLTRVSILARVSTSTRVICNTRYIYSGYSTSVSCY